MCFYGKEDNNLIFVNYLILCWRYCNIIKNNLINKKKKNQLFEWWWTCFNITLKTPLWANGLVTSSCYLNFVPKIRLQWEKNISTSIIFYDRIKPKWVCIVSFLLGNNSLISLLHFMCLDFSVRPISFYIKVTLDA